MDELDEFNEATHIVHGDVHSDRAHLNDDDNANHDHRQRISSEMLDDEDEDIVLSTDDLLRSSEHANLKEAQHGQRIPNGDLGGSSSIGDPSGQKSTDWYTHT